MNGWCKYENKEIHQTLLSALLENKRRDRKKKKKKMADNFIELWSWVWNFLSAECYIARRLWAREYSNVSKELSKVESERERESVTSQTIHVNERMEHNKFIVCAFVTFA